MAQYQNHNGLLAYTGRDALVHALEVAESELRHYNWCLKQPLGSYYREEALESNMTREDYEKKVAEARVALNNYSGS